MDSSSEEFDEDDEEGVCEFTEWSDLTEETSLKSVLKKCRSAKYNIDSEGYSEKVTIKKKCEKESTLNINIDENFSYANLNVNLNVNVDKFKFVAKSADKRFGKVSK
jgi:hypothetical protein